MSGPVFNKHKFRSKFYQFKQQCKILGYKIKVGAQQVFIPLAIYQLIRTILVPTAFDVLLLVAIFIVFLIFIIDWI